MFMKNEPVTADQIVSFADKHGNETEIFISNVATPRLSIAKRTSLVWMAVGPKHNNGDSKIRIDVLYSAICDEAMKGTGMHFELYESNLSQMLIKYADHLPDPDREIFINYAESKGHLVSSPEYLSEVAEQASSTMDEIRHHEI